MTVQHEVCVESADGVRAALTAGADRVELCASLAVGGTTPPAGLIEWAAGAAARHPGPPRPAAPRGRMAVHVLIRPRDGDFVYGEDEEDAMSRGIAAAKAAGADGVVLGALTRSGDVDVPLCARLIALARPLSVTFHRAFDVAADPAAAFDDVVGLGADRLLTSGAAPTAPEGAGLIETLVIRSEGRIRVMAGGGVTERTAASLVARTGVRDLHFSARASAAHLPLAERVTRIMATVR